MSYKPVSIGQVMNVQKQANEKEVGSDAFQRALDNGSFGRFLEGLKTNEPTGYVPIDERRFSELVALAENISASVSIARRVLIRQGELWQEAVDLAGETIDDDIRRPEIYEQYRSVSQATVEKDIVFFGFKYDNEHGRWERALEWAERANLKRTNPREVFAIRRHRHTLKGVPLRCQVYKAHVIATTDCVFHEGPYGCVVQIDNRLNDPVNKAYLEPIRNLGRRESHHFAFCDQ